MHHHKFTHEPLCLLMHNIHLCWTLYLLFHWTVFAYLMNIWPMIHIATSLFLVTQCTPAVAWPIMSHCTARSGTYCSFTSDEPCAHFLDYHLYSTHLYVPFAYTSFPPDFRHKKFVQCDLCPVFQHVFASPHFTSFPHLTLPCPTVSLEFTYYATPGDHPLPPDHTLRASLASHFNQVL